jgi:hypothetical protein
MLVVRLVMDVIIFQVKQQAVVLHIMLLRALRHIAIIVAFLLNAVN